MLALVGLLGFLFVGLLGAILVWPTQWRYAEMKRGEITLLVRTDRFNGKAEYLSTTRGWVPMRELSRGGLSQSTLDLLAPAPESR